VSRSSIGFVAVFAAACVEPSQARVTETPEQLLDNNDCASYKPVKGVMPGASTPTKPTTDGEAPAAPSNDPCAGSNATATPTPP
jgi:hypothetical protein